MYLAKTVEQIGKHELLVIIGFPCQVESLTDLARRFDGSR